MQRSAAPSRMRPQTADDEEAARLIRHLHYPLTTPAGETVPSGDGNRAERGLVNSQDESGAWRNTMPHAGPPPVEYDSRTYSRE
jgi:hypothetical protein